MTEGHDLQPYREPGYGLVVHWCPTCRRVYGGPNEHDKD